MSTNNTATAQAISEQTVAQMVAELAQLRAQNQDLIAAKAKANSNKHHALGDGLSCDIGPKGGVSVYGLNVKFPITLYKAQWLRLFSVMANLRAFIEANDERLAVKKPTVVK